MEGEPLLRPVNPAFRLVACHHAETLPSAAPFDDGEDRMTAAYRLRLDILRKARLQDIPQQTTSL